VISPVSADHAYGVVFMILWILGIFLLDPIVCVCMIGSGIDMGFSCVLPWLVTVMTWWWVFSL